MRRPYPRMGRCHTLAASTRLSAVLPAALASVAETTRPTRRRQPRGSGMDAGGGRRARDRVTSGSVVPEAAGGTTLANAVMRSPSDSTCAIAGMSRRTGNGDPGRLGRVRPWRRLANLDQMAVRVADVCPDLAAMVFGLGKKLGTLRRPVRVGRHDVRAPDVQECAGMAGVGRWRE